MSVTVKDLREGIAANIRDQIAGLNVSRSPTGNLTSPGAYVKRAETEWHQAMQDGCVLWTFEVQVYAGLADAEASQDILDEYVDPNGSLSVKQAIESDQTLGGVLAEEDNAVTVTRTGPDELLVHNDGSSISEYLGAVFTVEVYAPGD